MKLYLILCIALLISCGDPEIVLDESVYEPKIVIDGYLVTEQPIKRIFIKRNIPTGVPIEEIEIFLKDANVFITDLKTNTRVQLTYNTNAFSFMDKDETLGGIKYNQEYRIDVSATIDGRALTASATTKTPSEKVRIHQNPTTQLVYPKTRDEVKNNKYKITFDLAKGAEVYIINYKPLDKRFETYIQAPRNAYSSKELTREEFEEDKDGFEGSGDIFNLAENQTSYPVEVSWYYLNFKSKYRAIIFAGDQNYKDYYGTYGQVQDFDGNIDEPKFHINGEGIGIFGSLTTDTTFFEVTL